MQMVPGHYKYFTIRSITNTKHTLVDIIYIVGEWVVRREFASKLRDLGFKSQSDIVVTIINNL